MCFSLICGIQFYWFKLSIVFAFVEGEVFICVIRDEDIHC